MKNPIPERVAGKLQTVATLAGVGIIRPQRPHEPGAAEDGGGVEAVADQVRA